MKKKNPPEAEAKTFAQEAYLYSGSFLENYRDLQSRFAKSMGPEEFLNRYYHYEQLSTPNFSKAPRPDPNLLFSYICLDLRKEPIVLTFPEVEKDRYMIFQLVDLYGTTIGYMHPMEKKIENYLIALWDWKGEVSNKISKVFYCDTNLPLNIIRVAVRGPEDLSTVHAIQSKCKATPLSEFLGEKEPIPTVPLLFPYYTEERAHSLRFIEYLNFLLSQVKLGDSEEKLLKNWKLIGIAPGIPFDSLEYTPEARQAMDEGVTIAREKISQQVFRFWETIGQWKFNPLVFGKKESLTNLQRAAFARVDFQAPSAAIEYGLLADKDEDGEILDGSRHRYTLHFSKMELPPVEGFWSLTPYGLPKQLLVSNALGRYSIASSGVDLKYNSDGSLTLYLQEDRPLKAEQISNWLPIPGGPFLLDLRLYLPKEEVVRRPYSPPPLKRYFN